MKRFGTGEPKGRGRMDTQLISRDLSATAPPTVETPKREPNWERRQREHDERQARVMNLFEQMAASMGGILAVSKAPPLNDVLLQGAYTLGAGGVWARTWPQPFAAVAIANLGAEAITVSSAIAATGAPKAGAGVLVVPSGIFRVVPMRGTSLTLYGTATGAFDIAVFIRPRTPQAGSCGTG